jgi:hypothetical protein
MGGCRVFTTLGSTEGDHSELVLQRIAVFLESCNEVDMRAGRISWSVGNAGNRPGGTATATMLILLRHSGVACEFGSPIGDQLTPWL